MAEYPHPAVDTKTFQVTNTSTNYPLTDKVASHVGGVASVNVWFRTGDSDVIVTPGEDGAMYAPRNTFITFPRVITKGPTHFAVISDPWDGSGPDHPEKDSEGFINVVWMNDYYETWSLINSIHNSLKEQIKRKYGESNVINEAPQPRRTLPDDDDPTS